VSNVIYFDFKKDREQKETLEKIKAQNQEATGLDLIMDHPMQMLENLTVKPYALNVTVQGFEQ